MLKLEIIYSKYNRERLQKFQIETTIYERNGQRFVKKRPLTNSSIDHVRRMFSNYNLLKANYGCVRIAQATLDENEVVFEYIQGKTLDSILIDSIIRKDKSRFYDLLREYYEYLRCLDTYHVKKFQTTPEFFDVFGVHIELEDVECLRISNIDMIFDNIILNENGEYILIDYEWVFKFPVPIDYVFCRTINLFYSKYHEDFQGFINIEDIYSELNINQDFRDIFIDLEERFQKYVFGETSKYTIQNNYQKKLRIFQDNKYEAQLYIDQGNGFSEENSVTVDFCSSDRVIEFQLNQFSNIKQIRFDPSAIPVILKLDELVLVKNNTEIKITSFRTNAVYACNSIYIFNHDDPQFHLNLSDYSGLLSDVSAVKVKLEYLLLGNEASLLGTTFISELQKTKSIYTEVQEELERVRKEIASLHAKEQTLCQMISIKEKQIQQILSSTSWKITSPLRIMGRIGKVIEKNIRGYVRRKYPIDLVPKSQLRPLPNQSSFSWESLGNDPYFYIEGNLPTGWVRLSITISSDFSIPVQLYVDRGNGFNEEERINLGIFGNEMPEQQHFILHLDPSIKKLRLDIGDKPGIFELLDFHMDQISREEVFLRSLYSYCRRNGISVTKLVFLFKKGLIILRREGIKSFWNKVKNYISVDSSNSVHQSLFDYEQWVKRNELTEEDKKQILKRIDEMSYRPVFSIIMPVYNVEEKWLRKCIDSVLAQLYPDWELCIADDASTKPHIKQVLDEYMARDSRIKVVYRKKNGHISAASNSALELATGEFIALLDNDDELTPDALYENALLLNEHPDADMIYSDEDKITEEGERHSPFFKPDWSPDLILSQMYTCHLGVYRTKLAREIGGFRVGFEGSQDYDFVLRFTEKTDKIFHIPKILYHWRTIAESTASGMDAKGYAHKAGTKALVEAVERRGVKAVVEDVGSYPGHYLVRYLLDDEPLISIVIPTRDKPELIGPCLESIFQKTKYRNFEVIVVDNGSVEQETLNIFKRWSNQEAKRFRLLRLEIPFNYSRLNNEAVRIARGELILLLNNDVEVITANWLEDMAAQAIRSSVGAVGAKLLYPDDTVQHSGVILGIGGVANHSHRGFDRHSPGYFGRAIITSNYAAVTGACLMVRKKLFEQVGGLNEELAVAFNDVDFCLKLYKEGFYNVLLPHVQLYHYESKSRGQEDTPEKIKRFNKEVSLMQQKWGDLLLNDPFYNCNLTKEREDFSLDLY
jgi:O-antigen biosynthesis protein